MADEIIITPPAIQNIDIIYNATVVEGATGPQGPQGQQGVSGLSGYSGIGYKVRISSNSSVNISTGSKTIRSDGIDITTSAGYTIGSRIRLLHPTAGSWMEGVLQSSSYNAAINQYSYLVEIDRGNIVGGVGSSSIWDISIAGELGPTGPTGSAGASGTSGFSGYSGASGTSGYSGAVGISGYSGAVGQQGIQGETGSSGVSGFSGVSGHSGFKGDTGLGFRVAKIYASTATMFADTSPTGIVSGEFAVIDGDVENPDNSKLFLWTSENTWHYTSDLSGAQGIQGPQGNQGEQGTQGESGYSGISGYSGAVGEQGVQGDSGISGYSGAEGISGYSGAVGEQGVQGESGYSGISGYSGAVGEQGFQGETGRTGDPGEQGISGYSGYSGAEGISGYSGAVGEQGVQGDSGISGYSGAEGISGYSGYSGATGEPGTPASTGDITFDGVKIQGAGTASGDGYGYSTIELVPDTDLYAISTSSGAFGNSGGQYLIIDPTSPQHIHIRAGGPIDQAPAQLILGGEKANVTVRDQDNSYQEKHYVTINTESTASTHHSWIFGDDGSLTFPDSSIQTTAGGTSVYERGGLPMGTPGQIITISDSGTDENSPAGNWAPAYWDDDANEWVYIGNSNSVTAI
jgi:hypothetical protein